MSVHQVFGFVRWLRRHPTILSVVLGTLGLLMIVVGVLGVTSSANDTSKLQEIRAGGGSSVRGTLVGAVTVIQKTAPSLGKQTSYCPRYAYTAADGVERTLVDYDDCVSNKSQLAGKTVTILVDSHDPSTAFIDEHGSSVGRTSFAIFAWSTLAIGVGLVTAAPIVAVRGRRGHPARKIPGAKH